MQVAYLLVAQMPAAKNFFDAKIVVVFWSNFDIPEGRFLQKFNQLKYRPVFFRL